MKNIDWNQTWFESKFKKTLSLNLVVKLDFQKLLVQLQNKNPCNYKKILKVLRLTFLTNSSFLNTLWDTRQQKWHFPQLSPRTEIPSQFIDGHRSPMGPIDGHQWSIDGHRWGFSNVDPIDGNRNFPSQKFVRLGHVQNFNKTLAI